MPFSDYKVALVTGASAGMGEAIVERLCQEGIEVHAVARRHEQLAALADRTGCIPHAVDVGDLSALTALCQGLQVDILVNNAGITRDNLLMKMSEEDFDAVLNTNLKGAFNCIKHISRQMLKQKSGHIVNISSVSGVMGNAGQVNYSASKAGVIGMTKAVAREMASRGITSNAVAPGFIKTDMTEVLSDTIKENISAQIPMRAFGETADVANLVAFLASDEAKYITGQVICVDGGMAM